MKRTRKDENEDDEVQQHHKEEEEEEEEGGEDEGHEENEVEEDGEEEEQQEGDGHVDTKSRADDIIPLDGGSQQQQKKPQGKKIRLGNEEFDNAKQVSGYLSKALQMTEDGKEVTKEQAAIVVDLLRTYHPKAQEKIGAGVEAVVVKAHPMHGSKCFFVVRKDGSEEDFSFRKCLEYVTSQRYARLFRHMNLKDCTLQTLRDPGVSIDSPPPPLHPSPSLVGCSNLRTWSLVRSTSRSRTRLQSSASVT